MSYIRRCYNESCECNSDGAFCDALEVVIDDCGVCESYCPKIEEGKDN